VHSVYLNDYFLYVTIYKIVSIVFLARSVALLSFPCVEMVRIEGVAHVLLRAHLLHPAQVSQEHGTL
jgi:hypothetical protein